jgi:hypothetical protein
MYLYTNPNHRYKYSTLIPEELINIRQGKQIIWPSLILHSILLSNCLMFKLIINSCNIFYGIRSSVSLMLQFA